VKEAEREMTEQTEITEQTEQVCADQRLSVCSVISLALNLMPLSFSRKASLPNLSG
jgi:hypothetical protein